MVALRHGKVFQKKILRIEGSVSCEWDEPIFRLSTIVFADGTRASCEGEHDMPYVVTRESDINASMRELHDESMRRLDESA